MGESGYKSMPLTVTVVCPLNGQYLTDGDFDGDGDVDGADLALWQASFGLDFTTWS